MRAITSEVKRNTNPFTQAEMLWIFPYFNDLAFYVCLLVLANSIQPCVLINLAYCRHDLLHSEF